MKTSVKCLCYAQCWVKYFMKVLKIQILDEKSILNTNTNT